MFGIKHFLPRGLDPVLNLTQFILFFCNDFQINLQVRAHSHPRGRMGRPNPNPIRKRHLRNLGS